MEDKTKEQILEHAKSEFPRECCGLVVVVKGREKYFACRNISDNDTSFVIDPRDYLSASNEGEILSVVHSHCNQRAIPSQIDLVSCETTKLPWHIVSIPNEEWHSFTPTGYKAPLLGRKYQYGVLDCYTLIVDWYEENLRINLNPAIGRPAEWWKKGGDIFTECFEGFGFRKIMPEQIRQGDVMFMQLGANVVNHVGIYLEPNMIIHHLGNRLSTRDVYGGWLRKHTRFVARHIEAMQ